MRHLYLLMVAMLVQTSLVAQFRVKIVDAATGEAVPYANINVADSENMISNADGYFNVPAAFDKDETPVTISYLGYEPRRTTVANLRRDNVVKLAVAEYEIEAVETTRPEPNALMAEVRKALKENYRPQTNVKNRIFYRKVGAYMPKQTEFEFTKSTGFSKKALAQANKEITAIIDKAIKPGSKNYVDVLADQYKGGGPNKLSVIKGVRFQDERFSTDTDEMGKSFVNIILKHLDSTKYYRVKSGLFGSKDTVSLRKDFGKKKKVKSDAITKLKSNLDVFHHEKTPTNPKDFEFIHDYEIYNYTYEGAAFTAAGELVYIIKFAPKKRRAIYSGKMYVSAADFGLARIDYNLMPGKKVDGLNLKLILGVKYSQNVSKGTLLYAREPGDPYHLQYASVESGQYMYINRPVKFIELTDDERDVVAFDFKIEGDAYSKTEFLNMSQEDLSAAGYADAREPDFKYVDIKKYDPNIWKEYAAIEPVEEMKRLQIVD